MAGDRVQIDSFQLNIPGLSQEEADRVGKEVVVWLEQNLAFNLPKRNMSTLNLSVSISDTLPKDKLSEIIAKQISKSME